MTKINFFIIFIMIIFTSCSETKIENNLIDFSNNKFNVGLKNKLLSKKIDIDTIINDIDLFLCLYQALIDEECLMDSTQIHKKHSRLILNYQERTKVFSIKEISKGNFIKTIKEHSNSNANQISYLIQDSKIEYSVIKTHSTKDITSEVLSILKSLNKTPSDEDSKLDIVLEVYIDKYYRGYSNDIFLSETKLNKLYNLFEN